MLPPERQDQRLFLLPVVPEHGRDTQRLLLLNQEVTVKQIINCRPVTLPDGTDSFLFDVQNEEDLVDFMASHRGYASHRNSWPALGCVKHPQNKGTSVRFSARRPLWKARARTND